MAHQIFVLEQATRRKDEWLEYVDSMRSETKLCDLNPKHASRRRRADPLEVIAPVEPHYDFQWTPYREPIVTPQVRQAFETAEITGLRFIPVRTQTTLGDPFYQELYEMPVTGWGGMAPVGSGIRIKEECPRCKWRVFTGYQNAARLFNLDDWDGSDLFLIWPLPRFAMATGKAREVILAGRFTGVKLVPLTELQMKALTPGFTPGSVYNWFDEPRASELAEEVERVLQSADYRS